MNIILKTVSKQDHKFLYDLLKERNEKINISHKKMPTFKNHVKFVISKPYKKWYVIIDEKEKVGSIYLSKLNEIGIFLKKNTRKQGIGQKALKIIMEKNPEERYLANINPKNYKSIKFFKNNNFKIIQYTYELIPNK